MGFPTEDEVRQVLSEVYDPELGINIIDLGLVYKITCDPEKKSIHVDMTLTSPGCPLGPEMTTDAYMRLVNLEGVEDCHIDIVWEPMWDPAVNPSEEVKIQLGFW